MFTIRGAVRHLCKTQVRYDHHGYPGGVPGLNMPFRRGMDSPLRFTIAWLILGTLGFGSPWLVVAHQMLRTVQKPPPEEKQEDK